MIHVMTSTYTKDLNRVISLNERLIKHDLIHHMFVEQAEFDLFRGKFLFELQREKTAIHIKPDGGEGGLGRSGTMVRFRCYEAMKIFIGADDSYVQLDSDVIIDESIIPELACEKNEVKGFYNPKYPVHLERPADAKRTDVRFCHLSGMTICAGGELFHRSIPETKEAMLAQIDFMLDEGFVPSEDVMLSYLLQRKDFKLTNLEDKYRRVFHTNGDIEVHRI